jgi:hypothetical protein
MPLLHALAPLQASLTYFSAEGVATIESLLARAIDRFLVGDLSRSGQQLRAHDPGAISFEKRHFDTCPGALSHGKTSAECSFVYLLTIQKYTTAISPNGSYVFPLALNDVISLGTHILSEPLITLQNHRRSCCFPWRRRETIEYSKLPENSVNN